MCLICSGLTISSFGLLPAKPFCSDANGMSCQALKVSYCTQDGQPVV